MIRPRLLIFLFVWSVGVTSCASVPKEIDGQKVVASRWVDGRIVYILEDGRTIMLEKAREMEEATRGLVLKPVTRPTAEASGNDAPPPR